VRDNIGFSILKPLKGEFLFGVKRGAQHFIYAHRTSVTFTPQQKERHLPLEGERQQKSRKTALDLATALRRWLYGRVVFETYGQLGEERIKRQDHSFLLNHS
jgi:hypothetical protein